ncbi:PREDICTED: probable cysteine--tRNA ligase, mitochondrial isoform X1 [Capra hircus]|uniref:probable cysteine--tRNA ligase, mitochondrial isoform X1 n=2 Tax=Capra hircus TaxID=9925 RepID=UPI0008471177|nr:PREDICTED: probable cysteine--tRNA ligase, mitochondrial isoform X1 [Capra hircus]
MLGTRRVCAAAWLLRAALGPEPGRSASGARGQGWLQPAGYDTGVKVYNSLTRRKDPLIVSRADAASWYSCGPTVYDHAHLGHACSYVRFDIIRRILTRVFGCNVVMVMGITDVDDKIIRRANEMSVSPASLARLYEEDFKQDMAALKVLPPTAYLRVTEHVPQIITFIERLIANGHAYCTAKGNVYFDLRSRGDRYGKLAGVAPGPAGEPVDSDKRHASDFALWKAAKPQEPFWGSPWGNGRPGWHIECSTIASLVFGSRLDIHSGGVDLAFPHHENEIAQCEAFHQCPQWGNYFLHSGHLHVKGGGEKMSKSLKNYITIKDFLRSASPDVFRLFCLRSSYRSAIDYSEGALLEARRLLRATAAFVEDARAYVRGQLAGGPVQEDVLWERLGRTKAAVQAALADDFDTVRAVDAVMDLVHHGNRQLKAAAEEPRGARSPAVLGAIVASVEQFFETVGISLAERQCVPGAGSPAALHSLVEELVRFRLKVRQFALASGEAPGEARQQRLLERQPLLEACDTLRRDLAVHGISIKERLVHVGAAGSEDRRPQTQELRTATVLRPLSHSKAFM